MGFPRVCMVRGGSPIPYIICKVTALIHSTVEIGIKRSGSARDRLLMPVDRVSMAPLVTGRNDHVGEGWY